MNKLRLITIINSILILGLIVSALVYYFDKNENKKEELVFVDNTKLFNEFNMTKEIKLREEATMKVLKYKIDSLYVIYKGLNKKSKQAKSLEIELNSKSEVLKNVQDNYTNNLTQNVWTRLNEYMSQYGKNNNLTILFGTTGNGNIMYAKEGANITNSVLSFCNKKYEGN